MLSLTHAAVGGAIGAEINQPAVAYVLGIIAHFVADKIPHFWPDKQKGKTIVMTSDLIITIAALVVVYFLFSNKPSIFWGAAGGATVDAVLVLTPIYKTKLGQWHSNRQPHKTEHYFWATDVLLILVAILWIYVRGAI